MKRLLFILLAAMALSCSKFDDSAIWDKLTNHESRISELERICKEMNAQIINLQTIVTALENNDYIISASPLVTGDGYTFIFKSGKSVVIYNGKDGVNGANGTTPQIGVRQDIDGYYYWTVDGEWLIVDGNKVRASAMDGTNGTNGVTPKFKIEDGNWLVSYDNGDTWEMVGRATGNDGIAGENGDSLFKRVYIEDGYVCFELNDEANTVIRIPLSNDDTLTITLEKKGTLSEILTPKQMRETSTLVLRGNIDKNDMRTLQFMKSLQFLDIRDAVCEDGISLNPLKDTLLNTSINEVRLPKYTKSAYNNLSYCLTLKKVVISSDYDNFSDLEDLAYSPLLNEIEYDEGVTRVNGVYNELHRITFPSTMTDILPCITLDVPSRYYKYESLNGMRYYYSRTLKCKEFICKATTPPTYNGGEYYYNTDRKCYCWKQSSNTDHYYELNIQAGAILYVPRESIELYRTAPLWENFGVILPLEYLEE